MGKPLTDIWSQVIDFENLLVAYRRARRGKGSAADQFGLALEGELLGLQHELIAGSYRPGPYRLFTIFERKSRQIAAAPFRDRVVQHALMNVIGPTIDRRFIYDCWACRKGKGAHRAVDRYQHWSRRHRYVLKMDVSRYFPSIDHEILKDMLRRQVTDKPTLALLDLIVDTSPPGAGKPLYFAGDDLLTPLERKAGIPIGNLTSQFFANLFLNDFDHWIKEIWRAKGYLRYVDDMVVVSDDKGWLNELREVVRERLAAQRLQLHPRKAHVSRTQDGLNLLGYVVYPNRRTLRNDNGHRFARKLRLMAKRYADGSLGFDDINPRVQSWIGHALHSDSHGLRRKIFASTVFARGAGRESTSA